MSEFNIGTGLKAKLSAKTSSYGNSKDVKAHIESTIEIDSIYLMDIITENWNSIDEEMRHTFARKVAALDWKDTTSLISEDEQEDEENFKWR